MNDLSPAAQAVLDAAYNAPDEGDTYRLSAAAVLEAAADQVLPAASPLDRASWSPFAVQIRAEILAIAAELRGSTTTDTP
jgi:hypothetical protein